MRSAALLLATLAGCSSGAGNRILLTVTATPPVPDLDNLQIRARLNASPFPYSNTVTVPVPAGTVPPDRTITLQFDPEISGVILLEAEPHKGDLPRGYGNTSATLDPARTVSATILLEDRRQDPDAGVPPPDLTGVVADLAGCPAPETPNPAWVPTMFPNWKLYAAENHNQNEGFAVGTDPNDANILRWGGTGWTPIQVQASTANPLYAVWSGAMGTDCRVAAGDHRALVATDGSGMSWTRLAGLETHEVRGLWGRDCSNVWAVGKDQQATAWYTADRVTWVAKHAAAGRFNAIYGRTATEVWVVGDGGAIFHTANGTNWQQEASGVVNRLNGIFSNDDIHYFAVGDAGLLLTSPGNGVWTPKETCVTNDLNAISGDGANDLFAVGNNGTIIASFDNGATWHVDMAPTLSHLRGASTEYSSGKRFAVGDGIILQRD